MASIQSEVNRGVSKIADDNPIVSELDSHRVNEIVTEVFQKKGLARPYAIEFESKSSMHSKPHAFFEGDNLHIVASTESELKRMIGRFVLERTWSRHEWLMTNHIGLYTAICMILILTLPAISFSLALLIPELRLGLIMFTVAGVVVFCIWTGHKVSIKSIQLLKKLTLEMVELSCMTEYDSKDYEGDYHKAAIAGAVICLWGVLVNGMYGMAFFSDPMGIFLFSLIPTGIAAVYFMFSAVSRFIDLNLCFESEEYDEELVDEEDYDAWAEYEDNEYLQAEFTNLIERMDLRNSLISRHGSDFDSIRAGYSKTEFANCRWATDFIDDEKLHIYCRDVSEDAARRYGTGILVKGSLRFYSELSTKRRAIYLFALFFGLCMPIVMLLGAYVISKAFGIGSTIFTVITFLAMWFIGMKQNEEARREFPIALRKTGVFKDYELEFYSNTMFSVSSRFDWGFLIAFQLVFVGLGILILVLV